MSLEKEIEARRAEVRSDGYSMSIGELINLYRDGELDIHPEFQRFYRWSPEQKSRLIESILLGIPIPSIFVSQRREDGVWDVIDGLQRLSTIFELTGELKDADNRHVDPLELTQTKYLPSLAGKTWEDNGEGSGIGQTNQLLIRRSKIDVKIILRESTESTKYELFQRLNTGGSILSEQEIRNVILIMVNREAYQWIVELAQDDNFRACTPLTERDMSQQYNLELVTRFIIFRRLEEDGLRGVGDLGDFLTDRIADMAQPTALRQIKHTETEAFKFTFSHLANSLGENSFRKYDLQKQGHTGGFSISAFEPIAMGLGYNYETLRTLDLTELPDVARVSKQLWAVQDFVKNSGSGVRASTRVRNNIPLGRRMFGNDNPVSG